MSQLDSEANDNDPESDLPPFDGTDELEDEEPGISIDPGTLLTTLDDEEGLDDELATDLDIGIELDAPPEDSEETGGELVLDIATLLNLGDEEPDPGEPDETGPVDFDASAGIQAPPTESLAGPVEEGTDEPYEDLGVRRSPGARCGQRRRLRWRRRRLAGASGNPRRRTATVGGAPLA